MSSNKMAIVCGYGDLGKAVAKKLAQNAQRKFYENYTTETVSKKLNDICKMAVEKGV